MRTVTIGRPNNDSVLTYSIYLDGEEYGLIHKGETKALQIPDGAHRLQVVCNTQQQQLHGGFDVSKSDILHIQETEGDIFLRTYMGKTKFASASDLVIERVDASALNAYGNGNYIPSNQSGESSNTVYALLAIFLGGLGVHKFYRKKTGLGVLYLVFCWTGIPSVIGFIEGIVALVKK
jgi:hypothetical protein